MPRKSDSVAAGQLSPDNSPNRTPVPQKKRSCAPRPVLPFPPPALRGLRDTAEAEADRAAAAAEKIGPVINPEILVRFAAATRDMLRKEDGSQRRDLVRVVARRAEITSPTSATVMGSKIELIRTLASNGGAESTVLDVRSLVPNWRAALNENENYTCAIAF